MRRLQPRFNPVLLSLAVALALTVPGFVQAQTADSSRAITLSIVAQLLSSALNELSVVTGVPIAFSPALLAGKTAPAVKGRLTMRQALSQLLAGSGLAASGDDGSIVIKNARSASDQASTLPAINVTGSRDDDGITEGTGSYTTRISNTAAKLNLSPRETPQTLTVVTRQKMDDFALNSVDNVLESTSTISILRRGPNGPLYHSRGFELQSQYDGIPNPLGIGEYNSGPVPDTAFFDKVEILQGASSLMSGAGEPGGTINMVRKRPTQDFQAHIEAELGSWKKKRLVGDVSGSLVGSGRIRGRAVALVDHSDSFIDYIYDNRQGFYGIVEADVTATTTIGTNVMYQKNDFNMHDGVPMAPNGADLGLPRSAFYGLADGDSTRQAASYTLNLEQKLPQDWSLKAAYTYTDTTLEKITNYINEYMPNLVTGSGWVLFKQLQQRKLNSNAFDLYASGPFQLFDRKHELVVGAAIAEDKQSYRQPSGAYIAIPNIYNYDGASISRPSGNFPDWDTQETTQRGVYGATRLNLTDSLKAILGTRISWYEYKYPTYKRKVKEDSVISPYAGLIFDINNNTSIYSSYSDIFKPQHYLKFSGGTIDPVVGRNYELGVKSEFLQGRLNASAAMFRLEQTNRPQLDTSVSRTACNGNRCYTAAGLVVSQGIDLGLNGELLPGWQVGAGYTWVNSKYGNGVRKGNAYNAYQPKQIFRAYTTYLIPGTDWTVGGNIRSQSRMYTQDTGFRVEQGGYTVIGLMAKYRIKKRAEVNLMVNNLFDHRYYESIGEDGTTNNFYGAPRNFAANLKYTF